jgi:hypothetical protein
MNDAHKNTYLASVDPTLNRIAALSLNGLIPTSMTKLRRIIETRWPV